MDGVGIIYSFRARLLIVLAALLVSTLAVQYYLNQRAARRRSDRVTAQERALAAGTALALKSISSTKYLGDLDQERGVPLLEEYKDRVLNVLVVNGEGRVDDSLDPRYRPTKLDDGSDHYFRVSEVALPKLVPGQAADELGHFLTSRPPHSEPIPGEPRAVPIALKTSEGNNYIVVVLGSSTWLGGGPRLTPIARRLLPTLALMLSAILVSAILVWGFTRPVDALAAAATRIASGDLDFSVPVAARRDEMGELASTFNGMIADLRRAREVEARLAQAERSAVVGRLASAIAHEIRNPLNYINLSLDHLRTSLAPSDPRKRAV
ncbi:MAG TPA: HAMP domain-containing protein, partial [Pyrinomonadaceae bacterium]|nr:HAMP domain-containing protein [Pyrinomonadaceae bacterium]